MSADPDTAADPLPGGGPMPGIVDLGPLQRAIVLAESNDDAGELDGAHAALADQLAANEAAFAAFIEATTHHADRAAPRVEPVTPAAAATAIAVHRRTDAGNARRLVRVYGHDLRYVPGLGWHSWDGRIPPTPVRVPLHRHEPSGVLYA